MRRICITWCTLELLTPIGLCGSFLSSYYHRMICFHKTTSWNKILKIFRSNLWCVFQYYFSSCIKCLSFDQVQFSGQCSSLLDKYHINLLSIVFNFFVFSCEDCTIWIQCSSLMCDIVFIFVANRGWKVWNKSSKNSWHFISFDYGRIFSIFTEVTTINILIAWTITIHQIYTQVFSGNSIKTAKVTANWKTENWLVRISNSF